jgi:SHS2 domain-containing protein
LDRRDTPVDEKFRFLEHTADAKFQAFGRTLEEAFSNAALATAALMWDPEAIERKIRVPVRVQGLDHEQLLVHFLEEILYLVETRFFLVASVEAVRIKNDPMGYTLEGILWGDTNSNRYETYGGVKAITYNEMAIRQNDRFTIQVVVDI